MWLSATARRLVLHRFRRYREEAEVHGNRQGMGGTQIVLESHEQGQRDGTGRPSGKGRRGGTIPLRTLTHRVGNHADDNNHESECGRAQQKTPTLSARVVRLGV